MMTEFKFDVHHCHPHVRQHHDRVFTFRAVAIPLPDGLGVTGWTSRESNAWLPQRERLSRDAQ
jgi:hypothetical protein